MASEQIAANLTLINWTVLTGLALGSYAAVVLLRWRTPATKGFLAFTAVCAALFGLLAWASDGGITGVASGSPITGDPAFDGARRIALAAFSVLAIVTAGAVLRGGAARIAGTLGLAAGAAVLVLGALTWGGGAVGTVALFIQLLALAAATGGVFAGMILGHWYLVTPKLPEAPLIALSRVLLGVVAVQAGLFVLWLATSAGPGAGGPDGGDGPFSALVGPWALFVWLRLFIGLVFPLVITWAAVQTARSRSMESATGLLYIDVGAIAAGTILAAGLYFGAGLLV